MDASGRSRSARLLTSFRGVVNFRADEADFKAGVPMATSGLQFVLKRVAAWLCVH